MNGNSFFNNQFNNQFNNLPNNNGGTTPENHVKKKFFSSAFMGEKNEIDNVGGINSSSNNSVVAWGLGNNNTNNMNNNSMVNPTPNTGNMSNFQNTASPLDILKKPNNVADFNMMNQQPVEQPNMFEQPMQKPMMGQELLNPSLQNSMDQPSINNQMNSPMNNSFGNSMMNSAPMQPNNDIAMPQNDKPLMSHGNMQSLVSQLVPEDDLNQSMTDTVEVDLEQKAEQNERKRPLFFNNLNNMEMNNTNQFSAVSSDMNSNIGLDNKSEEVKEEYPGNTEQLVLDEVKEEVPEELDSLVNNDLAGKGTANISPEALEMLQNVNGKVVMDEPEVLDDFELPELKDEYVEELDLPEEKKDEQIEKEELEKASTVEESVSEVEELDEEPEEIEELDVPDVDNTPSIGVPKVDQGIEPIDLQKPVIPPTINPNTPSVGVFKPQSGNENFDFGFKNQVVEDTSKPNIDSSISMGAAPASVQTVPGEALPQATMQNSAIFQASQQNDAPSQPVNTVVNNSPAEQWMADQPLSANSVANSTASQSNVISANKREEMEKQKANPSKGGQTVPEEVTKKASTTDVRPELLAKEFVGQDYQSLVMSPFNFGAFVFGSAYYAYRKMYIIGIINLFIVLGFLFFIPLKYNVLAVLGFHIFMALTFNRVYVIYVKLLAKSAKRSNDKKKAPKTQVEMEGLMRAKGRVSVINGVLTACIFVAGIFFLSRYVLKENEFSKFLTKSIGSDKISYKKIEYQGTINYDDGVDINDLIKLDIPEGFEGSKGKYIDYSYTTEGTGAFNQCTLKIGIVKGFKDGNSFITEMAAYNEEGFKVKSLETKGINWTNYYTEDDNNKIYYKGTTVDNKAILLEYKIGKDTSDGVCDTYFYLIMDSVELKEE